MDTQILKKSLKCGCPKCGKGSIFSHKFTLDVRDACPNCGLPLKDHDSGDGPAVFLIFALGFLLVPLALWVDTLFIIPLWGHAVIWCVASILICLLTMQPLKAYVLAINYKHRGKIHGV